MQGSLLVEVHPEGVRLAGRGITPEALEATVRQRLEEAPDLRVLVKPSEGVDLQQTVGIVDRLAAAGAANMTLIRAPEATR